MRTIEGKVLVTEDGEYIWKLPANLVPGEHRLVVEEHAENLVVITRKPVVGESAKQLKSARKYTEIDTLLAKLFTAEELELAETADFSNLVIGDKSISEMINEDREDRFCIP
jgi:hypothetical protein